MASEIENLLKERRFGVISRMLYEDPELVNELMGFLDTTDSETQVGILSMLGRHGFDHPEQVYPPCRGHNADSGQELGA